MDIPGDVSILSEFFLEIQKRNLQITGLCKTDLPVLSEVFGGTESSIGRFLEFYNPRKDPICFQDLELETGSGKYPLLTGPQFLIPGETILKVETGSILLGTESVSFPWSDLKKRGDWILKSKDAESVYKNSEKTFWEGGRYYSSHENFYSLCSEFLLPNVLERFCMNPGFEVSDQIRENENPPFCDSNEFKIEEVNFTGLYLDGKVDQKQKFIDLEYSGNIICNPNSLSLESDGREIPVWLDSKTIRPGNILTLGKRDFLREDVLVSLSELKDFEFGKSVFFKGSNLKKDRNSFERFFGNPDFDKNGRFRRFSFEEGKRLDSKSDIFFGYSLPWNSKFPFYESGEKDGSYGFRSENVRGYLRNFLDGVLRRNHIRKRGSFHRDRFEFYNFSDSGSPFRK